MPNFQVIGRVQEQSRTLLSILSLHDQHLVAYMNKTYRSEHTSIQKHARRPNRMQDVCRKPNLALPIARLGNCSKLEARDVRRYAGIRKSCISLPVYPTRYTFITKIPYANSPVFRVPFIYIITISKPPPPRLWRSAPSKRSATSSNLTKRRSRTDFLPRRNYPRCHFSSAVVCL